MSSREIRLGTTLLLLGGCIYETPALTPEQPCTANNGQGPCGSGEMCVLAGETMSCWCGELGQVGDTVCGAGMACLNEQCVAPCGADNPCGVGETCAIEYTAAVCHCGETAVTESPVCIDGRVCQGPDPQTRQCNLPPKAVIGDGSETVQVAAGESVFLSGASSTDPDGDPLTFRWELTQSDCVVNPDALVRDQPRLNFLSSADGQCEIELWVSDGLAEPVLAKVTVSVVTVGTHVSSVSPCAADRSADPTTAPGTVANPWCSLTDGVWAAQQYHLAEVRVAIDPNAQTAAETIVIPPGVRVQGGYDRAQWAILDRVTKSQLFSTAVPAIVFAPGAGGGLSLFRVNIDATCTKDCFVVRVWDAQATIDGCEIGSEGGMTTSGGASYSAILAGSQEGTCHLELTDSQVFLATSAAENSGVTLDGRLGGITSGLLENVTIESPFLDARGGAHEIVGFRLFETQAVFIRQPVVNLYGSNLGAATLFGILDGALAPYTRTTCPGVDTVCSGSTDLTVSAPALFFGGGSARNAGLALFGSQYVVVTSEQHLYANIFAVASDLAVALWTIAAKDVFLSGASTDSPFWLWAHGAESGAGSAPEIGLVAAHLDGIPIVTASSDASLVYGSSTLSLNKVDVMAATLPGANPVAVAGTMWAGTKRSTITECSFQVYTGSVEVALAAGLWTLGTESISIRDNIFTSLEPELTTFGTVLSAGFVDGAGSLLPNAMLVDPIGSNELTLEGNDLSAWLGHADMSENSQQACVLLLETSNSQLGGATAEQANRIGCQGPLSWNDLDGTGVRPELNQVRTVVTSNTRIIGNIIGIPGPLGAYAPEFSAVAAVGVHEGGLKKVAGDPASYFAGSQDLVITHNDIGASTVLAPFAAGFGLLIDSGGSVPATVSINNNAITGPGRLISTGAAIVNGHVTLANNTILGGGCIECIGGTNYSEGLLISPSLVGLVNVANNIIDGGNGLTANALVDQTAIIDADNNVTFRLQSLRANVLAWKEDSFHDYALFLATDSNVPPSLVRITAPIDYDQLTMPAGGLYESFPGNPGLCPDRTHLDPDLNGNGIGVVVDMADASFSPPDDIDHEDRGATPDIGADELSADRACMAP